MDPTAPLDDPEPLAERLASAKVIAIGENTHLVREFYLLRHRLHRLLTQRPSAAGASSTPGGPFVSR